jgi:phage terminase large subunit
MISLEFSKKYQPLFKTNARYIDLWGGRGRGGSHTATEYFLHLITCPGYFRGYFMREIFSDIRESLWRDFKDRIQENDSVDENDFDLNETSMTATYKPTGNTIMSKGFKKSSGNRTAKLKSIAGATHVLIEEFDEIGEQDFNQLDDSLRTVKGQLQVIRVFNPPPKNHWLWRTNYTLANHPTFTGYYTAKPTGNPYHLSIFSTFRDNMVNLNQSTVEKFLRYQETDPEYYATIIEGLISEGKRGRIFRNWKRIAGMPGAYEKYYGLDFGFNDPVALCEIEQHNKTIWTRERIYESGLTNSELSNRMKTLGIPKSAKIYADSAEPKAIRDLQLMGWNVIPQEKGPDSILNGIRTVLEYDVHCTEDSKNFWKENEEYCWALDQHKNPTNHPIDEWNHLKDAFRGAVSTKNRKPKGISII